MFEFVNWDLRGNNEITNGVTMKKSDAHILKYGQNFFIQIIYEGQIMLVPSLLYISFI